MGIALAKSQSARELSHQLAFMGSCLTISHTCLPSHVFASFAFLMFTFLGVQKRKWGAGRGGGPTKNPKINKRGETITWNWRVFLVVKTVLLKNLK